MNAFSNLPVYQCHKKVNAAKINVINGTALELSFQDGDRTRIKTVRVDPEWIERHKPEVGGYFVAYDNNYTSYSPADAFESGYTIDLQQESGK